MTPDTLHRLIKGGETLDVEFKGEEFGPLSDSALVEATVCLANRSGTDSAWLVIGVEDDGRVTGARPRHGQQTDLQRLQALIANRSRPALVVRAEQATVDGLTVLILEVPPMRTPVGTPDGKFIRRAIGNDGRPACLPMGVYEIQSLQADRGLLDPSAQIIWGAHWGDLDPLEFERFRRSVRERRGRSDEALLDLSDADLAKALGVVESNDKLHSIRLAGLLVFGKDESLRRFVPTHEVAFQVLHRLEVANNDFFRWPLVRTMEEIEARIRARNREQELMIGMLRVGVPDYSERALREATANALIHRDYHRLGAVHFQWHDDRIEISNPGGFPEGVRLDNLLVTAPRPRNPLLADVFKRAGIVERTARGIDTIFYEQLRNGRPAPSYARSDDTTVAVVLPGGQANLDFIRLTVEEGQAGRVLGLDELLVLNSLWQERALTTEDAARLVQKPETEARTALHRLLEAGLVEERGVKKGRTWHLSAAIYQYLGEKAAYVRQRGFEPLQQEQMVLQYAEKYGRITRKEAAELCRIGPYQASRLLNRLVKDGRLLRHGERKGAWYERSTII
jgi:ATP-dependent DNA helicase RecG